MNKLSALLMAAVMLFALMPLQADAASPDVPVICGAFDSNDELLVWRPGVPVASDGTVLMFGSPKMQSSDAALYCGIINDDLVYLDYGFSVNGMDIYSVDITDTTGCVTPAQAELDVTYTLQVMNTDKEVMVFDIVIVETDQEPTDDGLYWYGVDFDDAVNDYSIALPAAVLNDRGEIVAVVSPDGDTYGFSPAVARGSGSNNNENNESNGGSGNGTPSRPSNDDPSEEPTVAPTEAPTEPVVTAPPATEPPKAEEPTAETEAQPDGRTDEKDNDYLLYIIGGGAVLVLAVVAVLIMKMSKPKPPTGGDSWNQGGNQGGWENQGGNQGGWGNQGGQTAPDPWNQGGNQTMPDPWNQGGNQTMPDPWANQGSVTRIDNAMGATVGGNTVGNDWEAVPEKTPRMQVVDSCGLLGGASFPIRSGGALVGRAANADIRYPADTKGVSRDHCRLFWQGNKLMVIDNGSTSGTYLKDKGKIRTGVPVEVNAGDVIYLGSKQISLTVKGNY